MINYHAAIFLKPLQAQKVNKHSVAQSDVIVTLRLDDPHKYLVWVF